MVARNVPGGRGPARWRVAARRRNGAGHGLVAPGGHDLRHRLPAGARVGGGHRAARERPAEPARPAGDAARALVSHLHAVAPWGVRVTADIESAGSGFQARTGGPGYQAIAAAMD